MRYLFLFLLLPSMAPAQRQEGTVLLYNACFGGLTSGIGAVINKPNGVNWKQAFVEGAWQGSIGGALNYSGKKMLYLVNKQQQVAYGLPAKLLHAAGTSIIENAALGEPFLQNWSIDYGPVRFDFSTNGAKKLRARFLPASVHSVIMGSKYNRLDLKATLLTGSIAFANYKGYYFVEDGSYYLGKSYGRAIAYMARHNDSTVHETVAHELVHQFQFRDYQIFNTWLKPLETKVKSKVLQTAFSKYVYFDVPYFWIAINIEGSHKYPHYYRNFFEFEAQRFSTNRQVIR